MRNRLLQTDIRRGIDAFPLWIGEIDMDMRPRIHNRRRAHERNVLAGLDLRSDFEIGANVG